ncbi:hypothetical protein TWF281_006759 [Arthrobotrys megalospora]
MPKKIVKETAVKVTALNPATATSPDSPGSRGVDTIQNPTPKGNQQLPPISILMKQLTTLPTKDLPSDTSCKLPSISPENLERLAHKMTPPPLSTDPKSARTLTNAQPLLAIQGTGILTRGLDVLGSAGTLKDKIDVVYKLWQSALAKTDTRPRPPSQNVDLEPPIPLKR